MTNGISRAIVELARAGKLSATSAITTSPHWLSHASWLARIRGQVSTGLHLNLTLGAPLGAMPQLAPDRRFPSVGSLTAAALLRRVPRAEVIAEINRQFAAFEDEMGFAPDHVDGHQHVHALPVIRDCLLEVMKGRYGSVAVRPLLRNPSDALSLLTVRSRHVGKAALLATLSKGFGDAAQRAGFTTTSGFSGVTDFRASGVERDFAAAANLTGPLALVMCHPGFVDAELERIDPVTTRRQKEFDFLSAGRFLSAIWRPLRSDSGPAIDWRAVDDAAAGKEHSA